MRSGRLRKKITIQHQPVAAQNALGEDISEWKTFKNVYAAVEPLNGREFFSAQQSVGQIDIRFRIRYLEGVTSKMRILYDGRTFNIYPPIDPEERHRELIIMGYESNV